MKSKDSMDNMLRALDGQQVQLDGEIVELLQVATRLSHLHGEAAPLDSYVKEKIWNERISLANRTGHFVRPKRYRYHIAAGLAAGMAAMLATVLAFALIPSGGKVIEKDQIARLQLSQGEIRVLSSRHEERQAADSEVISNGDSVIASPGTRGIVEYESGSIMRLEGEAEVRLSTNNGGIETEVIRGKSYHRVVDGGSYVVSSHGVRVVADGTAFTFEIDKDTEKVVSLESSLSVEVLAGSRSGWKTDIKQGEGFFYQESGQEAHLAEVPSQDLNNDWLRWNKNLDTKLGLPLGVLADVGEKDPAKEELAGQPETPAVNSDESTPIVSQPSEDEVPLPPGPASPGVEKTLVLSAQTADAQVSLSWTLAGYSNFQGFKLFRSETNAMPDYPDDWWKYIDGPATRSSVDNRVLGGHTYYYRLGVYNQGLILGYSNAVQISVAGQSQELNIILTASQAAGKVNLSWDVSGDVLYDGFKVCRSETNPEPAYPAEWVAYITGATAYSDADVKVGTTYYYRVGIYRNGSIFKYSNAVTIAVP